MVEPERGREGVDPLEPRRRRRGDAPLDLAGDLPGAARARPHAPLDDRLRQQPPRAPSGSRCGSTSSPPRARPARRGGARGDRARPPRLARARGAHDDRGAAEGRRAALPGRDLLARARHRHGRGRPRDPGRVAEVGRARAAADRPRPATASAARARAASSRSSAPTCSSARSSRGACARARSSRPSSRATRSTCSPSRSSRSRRAPRRSAVDELFALVTRTHSYGELRRELLENVLDMLDGRYPSARVRRAAPADRLGPRRRHDPRAQGRAEARGRQRRHDPRPRPVHGARCPTAAASASSTRRWSTRRVPGRRSCSARRPGGSRRSAATA